MALKKMYSIGFAVEPALADTLKAEAAKYGFPSVHAWARAVVLEHIKVGVTDMNVIHMRTQGHRIMRGLNYLITDALRRVTPEDIEEAADKALASTAKARIND